MKNPPQVIPGNPGAKERNKMKLIKRMVRITTARIEALLSSVEDPEIMFPQLIREMEEQVQNASEAEAQALTALKSAERALAAAKAKTEKLQAGAVLALENSDETMAREALTAQVSIEKAVAYKADAARQAAESYRNAQLIRQQTQSKLDEIKSKRDEILTRARLAKTQKRIEKSVFSPIKSNASILDAIEALETKVEQSEAELAVQREISGSTATHSSLEQRINQLETDAEVDDRLAALKARMTAGAEQE
jgi:phage shock protein A